MISHKYLADLCAASYELYTFRSGDVEVAYHYSDDAHIFAIRGTEISKFFSGGGWMDMLRNIAWWPKSVDAIEAHAGFAHGWNEIKDDIKAYVVARDPSKPIVLTGHSAGGAIALVGAYKLLCDGFDVKSCVTFGAPRVLEQHDMQIDVLGQLSRIVTQYQIDKDPIPGMLKWTKYEHINSVFIGPGITGERAPWYKRRMKHHGVEKYCEAL